MLEVARILECWDLPVQLAEPKVDGGIAVAYRADVALEVPDVHWVEANDCDKESNVGLSELISDEVVLAPEHLLESIERLEERVDGLLVCALCRRESSLVHTICGLGQPKSASQ